MTAIYQEQFGQNNKAPLKDLIIVFQKMLSIIGFWAIISKISTLENTEFRYKTVPQMLSLGHFQKFQKKIL